MVSPHSSPTNSNTWLAKMRGEKLSSRQLKVGYQACAWGEMNGAKQINLVTLLCSTLAFKSQETKDLVRIPTLHELGIQFSHQPNEGAKQALGPRVMYPQGPSGYTH